MTVLLKDFVCGPFVDYDSYPSLYDLVTKTPQIPQGNYSLIEVDKEHMILELEVPGAKKDRIDITSQDGYVYVDYKEAERKDEVFLYKCAGKSISFRYILPKNGKVTSAKLEDGILSIFIDIEVPKQNKIEII